MALAVGRLLALAIGLACLAWPGLGHAQTQHLNTRERLACALRSPAAPQGLSALVRAEGSLAIAWTTPADACAASFLLTIYATGQPASAKSFQTEARSTRLCEGQWPPRSVPARPPTHPRPPAPASAPLAPAAGAQCCHQRAESRLQVHRGGPRPGSPRSQRPRHAGRRPPDHRCQHRQQPGYRRLCYQLRQLEMRGRGGLPEMQASGRGRSRRDGERRGPTGCR